MIVIRTFVPEHFEQLTLREQDQAELNAMPEDRADVAKRYASSGPCFSLFDVEGKNEKIIACGGLILIWGEGGGVGEAWLLTTADVQDSPLAFTKAVRAAMSSNMNAYNLHRVQCTVDVDFKMGIRWIKMIGFQNEGIMTKYGPDQRDYLRFAVIKDGFC